jgi:hypothetical protein
MYIVTYDANMLLLWVSDVLMNYFNSLSIFSANFSLDIYKVCYRCVFFFGPSMFVIAYLSS